MESPPQYPGAPKKSKTGLILGGIALAIVLCCCGCGGVIWYFFPKLMKGGGGFVGCAEGMNERREALLDYAKDHGDRLPAAKVWQDSIKPYLAKSSAGLPSDQPIRIPGPDDDFCDAQAGTGLSMNAALAGKKLSDIQDKMGTVLVFESAGRGRNKTEAWKDQPFETSPRMLSSIPRGWLRQGISGEAAFKDQKGNLVPISRMNRGGFRIQTDSNSGSEE